MIGIAKGGCIELTWAMHLATSAKAAAVLQSALVFRIYHQFPCRTFSLAYRPTLLHRKTRIERQTHYLESQHCTWSSEYELLAHRKS